MDLNESGIIEKPLKRTSTAICFWFFNFTLEYFKRLQSSEPLHAKLNPTSCLFGLRFAYLQAVIFFAFFLLVVRHWKTAGAPLFRFVFRFAGLKPWSELYGKASILVRIAGCWFYSYILLSSRNPKTNWCLSRSYGIRFGEKDLGLSTCKPWTEQAGGLDSILHEAAQDFEVFKNIQ